MVFKSQFKGLLNGCHLQNGPSRSDPSFRDPYSALLLSAKSTLLSQDSLGCTCASPQLGLPLASQCTILNPGKCLQDFPQHADLLNLEIRANGKMFLPLNLQTDDSEMYFKYPSKIFLHVSALVAIFITPLCIIEFSFFPPPTPPTLFPNK